jgi:peroxiredoxin
VVAISKDSPEALAAFARAEGFGFRLASDATLETARELGLVHAGADFRDGTDLARPAILLFGADGTLRDSLLTENWRERQDGEALVRRVAEARRSP